MRKGLFLLLIGIILPAVLYGQEGEYTLHWTGNQVKIVESAGKITETQYMYFEGAVYVGDLLPMYIESFPIPDKSRDYSVGDLKYEPVPDSLLLTADLNFIRWNVDPEVRVFSSGSARHFLDINIPAVKKNTETGTIERLKGFSIISSPGSRVPDSEKVAKRTKNLFNSLLATGYWYKFKVKSTGIYKLTYSDLVSIGLTSPANVRIFGYGGKQLSYYNSDPRPQDMAEIPLYLNKGSDGVFNEGDFVLFYAEGPVTWHYDPNDALFRQKVHGYSDAIFYFITSSHGEGLTIEETDNRSLTANVTVDEYDDYAFYEKELYNLIGSGRLWYSRRVDIDAFDTTFTFPNLQNGNTVKIEARMAGRSAGTRVGYLFVDGEEVYSEAFQSVPFVHSYDIYARVLDFRYDLLSAGNQINAGVSYNKIDLTDEAYLDYFTLNARCELKYDGNTTFFRDIVSVGEGNIAAFTLKNMSSAYQVWDVTDINNVFTVKGELNGSTYTFKAPSDDLHQYLAMNPGGNFPKPIIDKDSRGVGVVANQNLHNLPVVDYLIVAPPVFRAQAERLADFHRTGSGLTVEVVDPQEIYNEFSSGTPDVCALRDFFRHQYDAGNDAGSLQYVLLFGDGSYNNHIIKEGNTNYILTFQSESSEATTTSYTSDDFFGMLDEGEGDCEGKLDIGIGRFPVKALDGSDSEAAGVVDKILTYYSGDFTDWRRRLCFVGDDGYDPGGFREGFKHMSNADEAATLVESLYTGFELRKVYLDAYPQVSSATGEAYPDVNRELQNLFERGILVFSYFGHGSENQITGEIILQKSDLQSMKNRNVLPLFITATCQFSRYDNVDIEEDNNYNITALTSAGEEALINPEGGAAALLSTSRPVTSYENTALAKNVFSNLFMMNEEGRPYGLGEVISMAKNMMGSNRNKLNFTLLGDPAMALNFPRYLVCTDSVNGIPVTEASDTMKAFGLVTITGYVAHNDSTIMTDFNGYVYPNVYDKETEITTFGNDEQEPFVYHDQKNLLYKGKSTVTGGRFKFSFVVPKDISYNIGKGKISYYAENGSIDARGEYREVAVGGTDPDAVPDYDGPEINLFINDNRFREGGITDSNPYIYAELSDINGINTTGAGIGHDVVAVLDNSYSTPYVLNDYYQAAADDYTSGIVLYPLKELEDGEHYVDLKVWDVFNNSSEASVGFVVVSSSDLLLESIISYPNPAQYYTDFVYTHNSPDMVHEVVLEVFDLMGRLVYRNDYSQYEGGFVSNPIHWDFRSSLGADIGAGVYPYRLQVTTDLGTSSINQKLIIIR
jgi:hypothetical protein